MMDYFSWENMVKVAAVILFGSLLAWGFSEKEHKGYYLSHGRSYDIYINWENTKDEVAFRTYDPNEALRVFERLQKEYRNGPTE
jgi:hypothetical protein